MPLISKDDAAALTERFKDDLEHPAMITVFVKDTNCRFCRETAQVAQELSQIDPRIEVEIIRIEDNPERARELRIKRVPATVVAENRDYGIRFYGIPSGHEFTTYVEDVVSVSRRAPSLEPQSVRSIERVSSDVNVQVFVTPTCPYCPKMVLMAHQFSVANPRILSEMIESLEFPDLAQRYAVLGVPKTIVNDTHAVIGLLPEPLFTELVLHAAGLVDRVPPALDQKLKSTKVDASKYEEYAHSHEH